MATLTESADQARKAIKYGGIAMVAISLLWYLGIAAVDYYKKLYPAAPPPPTVDFGQVPAVIFPENKERPTLVLELPTGAIPAFPDRMMVYRAPTKRSGFADPGKAIETASALGFIFKPDQPTETNYVWTLQDQLSSKLDMNIISGHFMLTRTWQNNPALSAMANFTSQKTVVTETENYLSKVGLLPSDIVGAEKITPLKDDAGKMINALSLSDADFVQIDLFRRDIEEIDPASDKKVVVAKYPFYRTDPGKGLVRAIVAGGRTVAEKYIFIDYGYTLVQYDNYGTYPIISGEEAWNILSQGGGFVTISSPKTGEVKIRKMFLGYYDATDGQNYAMPIYIFLGDKGFVAYVSAVSETWIKK
jgi:hypothetical protein